MPGYLRRCKFLADERMLGPLPLAFGWALDRVGEFHLNSYHQDMCELACDRNLPRLLTLLGLWHFHCLPFWSLKNRGETTFHVRVRSASVLGKSMRSLLALVEAQLSQG